MRGNAQVIAQLNGASQGRAHSHQSVFLHAEMCHNWGYHGLGDFIRKQSIDEMKHAEKLIERILFLDATPTMSMELKVGQNVKGQLEADLRSRPMPWRCTTRPCRSRVKPVTTNHASCFRSCSRTKNSTSTGLEAQLHQIKEMGYERHP